MPPFQFTNNIVGAVLFCDAPILTQEYFLELFDRTYPAGYLAPLKAYPDSGYELFECYAKQGERVALALRRLECGSFVIFADDGAPALVEVIFSRPTIAAGAVVIKQGTRVRTSNAGREFVLLADVTFGIADLEQPAQVQAIVNGYEWNVLGQRTTAAGEVLPGEIDTISLLITDPPYGDPTLTVYQVQDAVGGKDDQLNGLGNDRGITRRPGESAEIYRIRVRSLPDTVSPNAIRRNLDRILSPYGISYDLIETWQITYQTAFDAPSLNPGTPTYQPIPPTNPQWNTDLFCYDDPRPEYPLQNVWLDEVEFRAAFIVVLERVTLLDLGLAYDDPGMVPADFRDLTTGFGRGTPAYDIANTDDPNVVYTAAYDGFDFLYNALVAGVFATLQEIKAYGVAAIVERRRTS